MASCNTIGAGDIFMGVIEINSSEPAGLATPDTDPVGVDDAVFIAFYRSHYLSSIRLAWLLTNGGPDSEDLVQDAFIRVRPHVGIVDSPGGYLRTTLVNLCREAHRRRSRDDLRIQLVAGRGAAASAIAAADPDSHLLALVADLPYAQRAALVLRFWADLPDREIAEVIGVRTATVRSLVHRASIRLRKELSHDD